MSKKKSMNAGETGARGARVRARSAHGKKNMGRAYEDDARLVVAKARGHLDAPPEVIVARRHVELRHREDQSQPVEARVQRVELQPLLLAALAHLVERGDGVVVLGARRVHLARVLLKIVSQGCDEVHGRVQLRARRRLPHGILKGMAREERAARRGRLGRRVRGFVDGAGAAARQRGAGGAHRVDWIELGGRRPGSRPRN